MHSRVISGNKCMVGCRQIKGLICHLPVMSKSNKKAVSHRSRVLIDDGQST